MRWAPAFLLPLAIAGSSCLPPELRLGSSDGSAGNGGGTNADVSQPRDGAGTSDADGSVSAGGAGGAAGRGGGAGAAGKGGAAGGDGAAGTGGAAGGDGAAGTGGTAGRDGAAGSSGTAGSGAAAGTGGAAGKGGMAGIAGRPPDAATDGASGSGGTMMDAASDVPPTPPCRLKYAKSIFCDDFEAPTLQDWRQYPPSDGGVDGATVRSTSIVHRGNGSLYSRKDGQGDGTPVYIDFPGPALTAGRLYLRTYLYVVGPHLPGEIPVGLAASILVLGERDPPLLGSSFVLWRDGVSLTIRGAWDDNVVRSSYSIPSGVWLCLQLDFPIGAAVRPVILVEGQDLNSLVCPNHEMNTCNTQLPNNSGYGRLWMGINWTSYDPPTQAEVYYDDVVVSTEVVPCD